MKIQVRLMLVIIPVLIIVTLLSSIITGVFSTNVLEKQVRENAQLLSHSFSNQVNASIEQYMNISGDLGNAVMTAIHIETTLKATQKRYPQFSNIFFTPTNGKVLDMAHYQKDLVGFSFSGFDAYRQAFEKQQSTISSPGNYFGQNAVIIFSPTLLSYVANQKPSVEGIVAVVLPLEELFKEIAGVAHYGSDDIFVVDDQGMFIHHSNADNILSKNLHSISSASSVQKIFDAILKLKTGFATYSGEKDKAYISFSPINSTAWSLSVYGTYNEITTEVSKIALINILVVGGGILIGSILLYFVVHSVVHPIEKLTTLAQKIAGGDRTITSDIQSKSEVGTLSNSINSMVSELREHHQKLEQIVEERTLELQVTNEELQDTVSKLNIANSALQDTRDNLELMVKERTKQLRKALSYIDNIIDSMPSTLIGVDPEGIITQWNSEAEKITGISAKEATGHPLTVTMSHLADDMGNIRRAIQTREKYTEPKRPRQLADQTIYENITIYPLVSNGVEGAVIRIDDVTERVAIEKSLQQSQKLDAIGQLAGGVAHDFNNMLSGILGAAQLLKMPKIGLDKKGLNYVELIIKSVSRSADLTAKLLAFGRQGELASTAIDIHAVIDDVQAIFNRTIDKNIQIVVDKKAINTTIIGDNSAIQNAIMNLGINSSHAMPRGGELHIFTRNIELISHFCEASSFDIKPGEYIEIEIRDTGEGISKNDQTKIFEPFFTTKEQGKGTGLGLPAVYGTIQNHKGAINVYSEQGTGTVFHIYLPCSGQLIHRNHNNEIVLSGSGTVLLIDDEEIIRVTGKYILENMGYDVLIAENGVRGMKIFTEQHPEIDVVIMDMIMPEMNGHEAFFKMKKIDNNCKIIIASGFTKNESLSELREAGLAGFLHKPFRDYELSNLLAETLAR